MPISRETSSALNLLKRMSFNLRETNKKLTDAMRENEANRSVVEVADEGNKEKNTKDFTSVSMDPDAIYEAPISKAKVFSSFLLLGIIFSHFFFYFKSCGYHCFSRGKFVTSVPNVEVQAARSVVTEIAVKEEIEFARRIFLLPWILLKLAPIKK